MEYMEAMMQAQMESGNSYREELEKDRERLEYLITSGAIVKMDLLPIRGEVFWLEWPELCEKQSGVFHSAREAIDAKMQEEST